MISHAPEGYCCPFCVFLSGGPEEETWLRASDLVFRDRQVAAFVSPEWWPRNPGHVLIVPNDHYENLYDLPLEIGARIHALSRDVALAMKAAYGCDGTSTRQHNEPAGHQEVWHYHLHVFPRFADDRLYVSRKARVGEARRAEYAARLRDRLLSPA
jgi:histidine triad (HIT) family protein